MAEIIYKGMTTTLIVGDETTYGTTASNVNLVLGKVKNFNPTLANGLYEGQGIGDGRNYDYTAFGPFDATWSASIEVVDWGFLKYLIGPLAGDGSTSSKCTITEADNIGLTATTHIIPFTIQVGSDNSTTDDVDTYKGSILNEVTINFTSGGVVTADLTGVSQSVISSTTATAYGSLKTVTGPAYAGLTYVGLRSWTANHVTLKWGTDGAEATVEKVQNGSITITNNNLIYRNLGSRFIDMPEAMLRRYNITLTCIMSTTATTGIAVTLRDHFYGAQNEPTPALTPTTVNPATKSMQIILSEGDASTNRKCTFDFDNCTIESMSKPVDIGGGLVQVTFNIKARNGAGTNNAGVPVTFYTVT